MARLLDQIIVLDIEATCWEGKPPAGQENEIIEVGFCLLNTQTGEITSRESLLVKPQKSTVSDYCTQLTTLTQAQVDTGISLQEVCTLLRKKYNSKERLWTSYGDYDRRIFDEECRRKSIAYPFGPSHLNIKTLYALQQGDAKESSLADALAKQEIVFEGTAHRGGDDAYNTAKLLWKMLLRSRSQSFVSL